jgi:hypothetical protein
MVLSDNFRMPKSSQIAAPVVNLFRFTERMIKRSVLAELFLFLPDPSFLSTVPEARNFFAILPMVD